jgi:glutaredoxin 3
VKRIDIARAATHFGSKDVSMAQVEIYTKFLCPYCARAKSLLQSKGVRFEETDITMDGATRRKMMDRAGGRSTVPQIFIDGVHVGGSDDLAALDAAGKLDPMLANA